MQLLTLTALTTGLPNSSKAVTLIIETGLFRFEMCCAASIMAVSHISATEEEHKNDELYTKASAVH